FFDDLDGAESERFGAGLDVTLLPGELFAGLEASRRNIVVPDFTGTGDDVELHQSDHSEQVYRAYLNWVPAAPAWLPTLFRAGDWAFSLEVLHERFRREHLAGLEGLATRVETTSVPFTVRYFSDTGVFLDFGATYLRQRVVLPATSSFDRTRDGVVLFDAAVGYRLPGRHGIVSFEVRNLFDEGFLYQDQNIQIAEASTPRFIPARTFLLRVVLNF
ncbi:MAG: TonB-dependent receptor, partial [Geminicoccales bacterium]